MPYAGASAGSNVAGPTILTTNDWNVVALDRSRRSASCPSTSTPTTRRPTRPWRRAARRATIGSASTTSVNANPVVGLEEGSWLVVEDGVVTVQGTARVKLFRRGASPSGSSPARVSRSAERSRCRSAATRSWMARDNRLHYGPRHRRCQRRPEGRGDHNGEEKVRSATSGRRQHHLDRARQRAGARPGDRDDLLRGGARLHARPLHHGRHREHVDQHGAAAVPPAHRARRRCSRATSTSSSPISRRLPTRLESVRERLAGTKFTCSVEDKYVAVTCPWGNRMRFYAPGPAFGDLTLGDGVRRVPRAAGPRRRASRASTRR